MEPKEPKQETGKAVKPRTGPIVESEGWEGVAGTTRIAPVNPTTGKVSEDIEPVDRRRKA